MKQWTKAEAQPILLAAFDNGTLAAQNGATQCSYRSAAGPCVIGVLIDDETAEAWDRGSTIGGSAKLFSGIHADSMAAQFAPEDHEWFSQAQKKHDRAAQARPGGIDRKIYLDDLRRFLAA